jgi:hypothetical protein
LLCTARYYSNQLLGLHIKCYIQTFDFIPQSHCSKTFRKTRLTNITRNNFSHLYSPGSKSGAKILISYYSILYWFSWITPLYLVGTYIVWSADLFMLETERHNFSASDSYLHFFLIFFINEEWLSNWPSHDGYSNVKCSQFTHTSNYFSQQFNSKSSLWIAVFNRFLPHLWWRFSDYKFCKYTINCITHHVFLHNFIPYFTIEFSEKERFHSHSCFSQLTVQINMGIRF